MTVKVLAAAAVAATMIGLTTGCSGSATCKEQEVVMMKSADFYTEEGTLDTAKAKAAYFAMMERLGAPVYDVYRPDDGFLWTVDFGQKDFAKFGMGGVFWVNNRDKGYFAHEIFLLPGQSIAEHKHLATEDEKGDVMPKHESWQVRHGSVYAFCEVGPGKGNLDEHPEIKAMIAECQAPALECIYVEKWEADGKLHELPRYAYKDDGTLDTTKEIYPWHFMMGGPEGAVVSEYATFHHNGGLRFTCPGAKL